MEHEFSQESKQAIEKAVQKYPQKQAALLPVLHIAQQQFGSIANEVIELVSRTLELPVNRVQDVVSFYTMYTTQPVGKYHIQVCRTLSCSCRGAEPMLEYLEQKCGVKSGEGISEDGKFSIITVECLGSCGTGPVMQVNDDYYENLTRSGIDELIEQWKRASRE
jgi:NADH-quinone oxidoreductase E subunit